MRAAVGAVLERTPFAGPLRETSQRVRNGGLLVPPRHALACTTSYLRDRRARSRYRVLDEAELRSTRTSDTVFVLGAGKSLLDITEPTWNCIAAHDTLSFSEFFRQAWVSPRYHMVGEVADIEEFGSLLSANPRFDATILLVQGGWQSVDGNELLGRRLLPSGTRVFRYRRVARGEFAPPSASFAGGVVHGWNSSISATNLALLVGWRRIVLTGIDLYDKEYFWLPPGVSRSTEKNDVTASSAFPNAALIVELFGRWRRLLEPQGVRLEVYNPRSLLAETLDVFSWQN